MTNQLHLVLVPPHRPLPTTVIDAVDGQRFIFVRDDAHAERAILGLEVASVTPALPLWPPHLRDLLAHRMRTQPAIGHDVPEAHRMVLVDLVKATAAGRLVARRGTLREQPQGLRTLVGLGSSHGFGPLAVLFEGNPIAEIVP